MPEPSEIQLRRGLPADAERLSAFMRKVFLQAFEKQNDPDDLRIFFAEAYIPAAQLAELQDPGVTTLLAETAGGELAAYAQVREPDHLPPDIQGPRPVELQRFYVEAGFHGHGLAQRLMQAVIDDARRRGGQTLWLGVWEHNPRGQAFYRKFGFQQVGAHTFPIGKDRQTDLLLSVAL